jgi:hypothetical protein
MDKAGGEKEVRDRQHSIKDATIEIQGDSHGRKDNCKRTD